MRRTMAQRGRSRFHSYAVRERRERSTHQRRCRRADSLVIQSISLHGATEPHTGCLEMIAASHMNDVNQLPVTDGSIALLNLQAQIEGLEQDIRLGHSTVEGRVGLIELITLRGLILGH